MYGQQQAQQQVQQNQQPMLNTMGPQRMISIQANRMAVPQTGMMNAAMQQQQSQQPVRIASYYQIQTAPLLPLVMCTLRTHSSSLE